MTVARSSSEGRAEEETDDRVELALPARPELLFLGRMTAAAVASRADFGYDQIEDLRLALDELCLSLVADDTDAARIELKFTWSSDAIDVIATLEVPDERRPGGPGIKAPESAQLSQSELSARILDALVDEHGSEEADHKKICWMRMRRHDGR